MGGAAVAARGESHRGSCLCGRIRYRVRGPLGTIDHCHCTDCRKSHAAAFATYVEVAWRDFELLEGKDELTTYAAASGTKRSFCQTCGSIVVCFSDADRQGVGVPASTFDTPIDRRPELHTFVRSKVRWYDIQDGLPQFETSVERSD